MKCPKHVLEHGTRVRTHASLDEHAGFKVPAIHLLHRRPNTAGAVEGLVGGHHGDVYWVRHAGDRLAAPYGFWELELDPPLGDSPGITFRGGKPISVEEAIREERRIGRKLPS